MFSFALIAYAAVTNKDANSLEELFTPEPIVELSIEERILTGAENLGINPQLALAVAKCESGLDQGAKNPNSTASGIFQFLKSTWKSTLERMGLPEHLDVFDASSNIMAGLWLMKQDGASTHWYPSEDCWGWAEYDIS